MESFFFSFNVCKCSFRAAAGAGSESEAADVANEHMLTINIDIVLKGAPCALTCLCRFGSRIQTTSKTSTTVMLWPAINFFHFIFVCFVTLYFSLSPEDVGLLDSSESKTIINTKRKNWIFVFTI